MPAFVDALDLPDCKGALDAGEYKYSCGLKVNQGVADIPSDHYSLNQSSVMAAAHRQHHDGAEITHDPTATLYFGEGVALCSCGYDSDA